ncbi:hypothetical protein H5203_05055 [Pseudoalteromonas sp. SG41-1]|nr:hypothetical protein [Pseudoalteromonas sp. SG41-1]
MEQLKMQSAQKAVRINLDLDLKVSIKQYKKIKERPVSYKDADIACIKAIAQAAINVELFTIPLYMTGLYSIQGMHAIGGDEGLYPERLWPGLGATAGFIPNERIAKLDITPTPKPSKPLSVNEQAFNAVYSVFIEEMLHLQLASNIASKLNLTPSFTSNALQTEKFGWHCYDDTTQIPHILDFKDCSRDLSKLSPKVKEYFTTHFQGQTLQDMRVNAAALTKEQALLFLLIEETEESAKKLIINKDLGGVRPKYFETAPFDWFKATDTEVDLPMFGSIGHMYCCYWDYLEIVYEDGSSLIDILVNPAKPDSVQRDYFNTRDSAEYKPQYPGINGSINESNELDKLKIEIVNNINAITDQGEGKGVVSEICSRWAAESWVITYLQQQTVALKSTPIEADDHQVAAKFQPNADNLKEDYPADSAGQKPLPVSGIACARITNTKKDHFITFADVLDLIIQYEYQEGQSYSDNNAAQVYMTWQTWHNLCGKFTVAMLNPKGGDKAKHKHPDLPAVVDVEKALNNLFSSPERRAQTHQIFSESAVGTLKGLTTALDRYWGGKTTEFPGPAMGGSGDRVSICWATTGQAPDLVAGIADMSKDVLYHACQGMDYTKENSNNLPPATVFHSCKGSNNCKAQGGCGFVHSTTPGGSCGGSAPADGPFSAPANNKCNNLGGCAVPISASQLFPKEPSAKPQMQLFEFGDGPDYASTAKPYTDPETGKVLEQMPFKEGDAVYSIAWQAYCNAKGVQTTPPPADDIRLALPPST